MSGASRVLVAVPALNEAASVASVVERVCAAQPAADVLVIDDGSSDATADLAGAAGAQVVRLPFNVGVGGAMRVAFLFALRDGHDAVVQVDADGQHDPAQIGALLAGLEAADVVVGSRFAGGGSYDVRGPRKWAMRMLSRSLTRMAGTPLSDTTSGFRASGPRAIELFARHYPAEYLGDTVDSLVIGLRAGLVVREVPVLMSAREAGRPSQNALRASLYLGRSVMALAMAYLRRPVTVEEV